ncbi:ABC transporter permease [Tepidamorphus sp. 3E244]|uniref:ABC transporter permease n=1 Tax=Tepidamorphus sp. 3E244 TaxID=3385498 RepID=UPI0038FC72A5
MSFFLIQTLNGLASASSLFIAACGLTIIFGVTRIVNFAHGSFYMVGAYLGVLFAERFMDAWYGPVSFWAAIVAAALGAGILGALMEVLLLRRIYRAPELFQLLATFAVVIIIQDAVIWFFGPQDILGPRAPGLRGSLLIAGERFPQYELLLVFAGPVVLGAIWLLFNRTRFGILVRAATHDRKMLAALGVNQKLLFTGTVFLGCALAGLGGALEIPKQPANPHMDVNIIAEAFVVTVIGGMGSVTGAFLAALLIGLLQAFGILIFPKITLVLVFLVMAVVLVVRPWGLLGKPEPELRGEAALMVPLRPWDRTATVIALGALVALALFPLVADAFSLKLAIEVMVFALFALSLNLLIGHGGVISFGHAAWFGIGAYAAALFVRHADAPMELALLAAPVAAGMLALAAGWFIVRLSGVYLAMLTLAVAQLAYAIAFQWVEVTGGDNGLLGIWPSDWANSRVAYYYMTLGLTALAAGFLMNLLFTPFGLALRAARDSALRAESLGIDVRRQRLAAFAIAGAAAGLAGGIYVFSKGNIDPTALAIPMSVDALTMALLGGVQTVTGPILGAAGLHLLKDFVMPLTDYWRALLGGLIIALVLLFPAGLAGTVRQLLARRGEGEGRA